MSDTFYDILVDWSTVLYRRSLEDLMRFAHETGLSMTQITVLYHLYYYGPCDNSRLVKVMQVSKAATSQMVERMVQQDLVLRSEVPGDRRSRLVSLTDKGLQIIEDSIAARQTWMKGLAETLSPEDRLAAIQTLKTLTASALGFDKKI